MRIGITPHGEQKPLWAYIVSLARHFEEWAAADASKETSLDEVAARPAVASQFADEDYSSFFTAIRNGEFDTVVTLLKFGADVNHVYSGLTPLGVAALQTHSRIVKLLLDRGADVNKQNAYGSTALHDAASASGRHAAEVVKILLDNGADPSIRDGHQAGRLASEIAYEREVQDMLGNLSAPSM